MLLRDEVKRWAELDWVKKLIAEWSQDFECSPTLILGAFSFKLFGSPTLSYTFKLNANPLGTFQKLLRSRDTEPLRIFFAHICSWIIDGPLLTEAQRYQVLFSDRGSAS